MLQTEIILSVSCNHCGMRFWRYMVDEDISVKTFSYNFILSVLPCYTQTVEENMPNI